MATKKATAIMDCAKKEFQKVIDRGVKVSSGIYENDSEYATPPIIKVDFLKLVSDSQLAQGNVKGGSLQDTDNRDVKVGLLYDAMADKLLPYTNGLYRGNKQKLLLSGFAVSDEYAPHAVPPAPVIGRVERGKVNLSAKIYLKPVTGPLNAKKERLTYFVWMKLADDDAAKFEVVLTTTNSRKLIITNMQRGKEVIIYLTCRNSAGESINSNTANFIAF